LEFVSAILFATQKLKLSNVYTGIVHCKSALYAREYGLGPRHAENIAYHQLLENTGILASEMETATLFIQSQVYNHQLRQLGVTPENRVLAGAILGVVATAETWQPSAIVTSVIQQVIQLALETVKTLAIQERVG